VFVDFIHCFVSYFTIISKLRYMNDSYPPLLTIIKPFFISGDKKCGCCVININLEYLIGSFNKNWINFVCANDGTIYGAPSSFEYTNINEIMKEGILNGEKTDVYYNYDKKSHNILIALPSQTGAFYYASLIPEEYFSDATRGTIKNAVILGIFYMIVAVIVIILIAVYSYKPIEDIAYLITKKEKHTGTAHGDDVKYIMEYINRSAVMHDTQTDGGISDYSMELKRIYNTALQAQINPHFLCNTLEFINWKAAELTDGENVVSDMICDLASIYEYTLMIHDQWVSIEKEIEFAKVYVRILKARYEDKFEVEWDVDKTILDNEIIKLSLQPIIENAVYHGIKPKEGSGRILVNGYRNGEDIIFEISDDGVGMSEEKLKKVLYRLNDDFELSDKHIGLANVNQRTKIVFGEKYGITIDSRENIGTCVKLHMCVVSDE
ncbi:MAG: sensor histidine kinase, partial [Monoglobaceae bacterium]